MRLGVRNVSFAALVEIDILSLCCFTNVVASIDSWQLCRSCMWFNCCSDLSTAMWLCKCHSKNPLLSGKICSLRSSSQWFWFCRELGSCMVAYCGLECWFMLLAADRYLFVTRWPNMAFTHSENPCMSLPLLEPSYLHECSIQPEWLHGAKAVPLVPKLYRSSCSMPFHLFWSCYNFPIVTSPFHLYPAHSTCT